MAFDFFLCSVISEHDVISDFIVVVKSMSIFADIIFINFSAFSDVLITNPTFVLSW